MIYLIPFFFILLGVLFYDTQLNKGSGRILYIFSFLSFVVLSGLRYKVGGDTLEYFRSFDTQIPKLQNLTLNVFVELRYEPLWIIFNSVCKSIVDDFSFLQFVHAFFVNYVLFRFFKNYTTYKFTAILVYFLFYYLYLNFEILRESIAICLFLLAYPFLEKKENIKYFLLIGCACMFHISAIILFILPFFKINELNRKVLIKMVLFVLLAFIFLQIAPFLIPNEDLRVRFIEYQMFTPSFAGFTFYLLIYFVGPLFVYFKYTKYREVMFPNLIFIYFTIAIIVSYLTGLSRFINYFMPFMTVYFVNFLFMLSTVKRYRQVKVFVIPIVFGIAFAPKYMFYMRDTSENVPGTHKYNLYLPYTSIFKKEEDENRELLFYRSFDISREYIDNKK